MHTSAEGISWGNTGEFGSAFAFLDTSHGEAALRDRLGIFADHVDIARGGSGEADGSRSR